MNLKVNDFFKNDEPDFPQMASYLAIQIRNELNINQSVELLNSFLTTLYYMHKFDPRELKKADWPQWFHDMVNEQMKE